MTIDLRLLITASLTLLAPLAPTAEQASVESFFKDFQYRSMVISPNGKHLAALYPSNGTTNALVVDLGTMTLKALTGVTAPDEVQWIRWKSDDALVYELHLFDQGQYHIMNIGAVERDGPNHVFLLDNRVPQNAVGRWRYRWEYIVDWQMDDPYSVLLKSDFETEDFPSIYKVKMRTGGRTTGVGTGGYEPNPTARNVVAKAPGKNCRFVVDHKGNVRVCLTQETDLSRRLLYRPAGDAEWAELARFPAHDKLISPLGFTDDDQALIVLSNVGRDTNALYVYEPPQKALGELVFEAPTGIDVDDGVFSTYGKRFVAASYVTDGPQLEFFDETWARIYSTLRAAFPKQTLSLTSVSADGKRAVALAHGKQNPGVFYLYDADSRKISEIMPRAPWLQSMQFGETRSISYEARDKTRINGFLVLPPGSEARNLPLIVTPHGGPIGVRDDNGFDPEAQFLASRGYAVLKLNFRGSGGYGSSFEKAGYREWGKKMQDDITDGVLWAISQGVADKARVCIYGASYGGYAAMMGLVKTPDLYRCGVTYAGVSDLDRLMSITRITAGGLEREISSEDRKWWNDVVGDRKDQAGLRAISPRYNAASIRVPVLIAHGGEDFTVPVEQATALRDELKRLGKPVEYMSWNNEGHGFTFEKNRIEFYRQLEAFLARNLGAQTATAAAQ